MKRRLHLVELEDQPWFPSVLRDFMTDLLNAQLSLVEMYSPALPRLAQALRASGATSILDLCSGGGGVMAQVARRLAREGCPVSITLSDRFPNIAAFERAARASDGRIEYLPHPVDATDVPARLHGFRTLFTSLHHFAPDAARRIFADAVAKQEGIAVFEFTERSARGLASMVLSPILTALVTPFLRPFRWTRLLFTYVLPIVPLAYLWDGVVSHLRTYSCDELRELVARLDAPDYEWTIGQEAHPVLPMRITYLIGVPPRPAARLA